MPFGLAIGTERAKTLEVSNPLIMHLNFINSLVSTERHPG
jgi:hypothetical protein